MDIFKEIVYANLNLSILSEIFGYDEEEIFDLLSGTKDMTTEERQILYSLLSK